MDERLYAFCKHCSDNVTQRVVHGEVSQRYGDGRVSLVLPSIPGFTSGAVFEPICVVPYDEGMLLKQKWDEAVKLYNDKQDYIERQCGETIKLLEGYATAEEKPFRVALSERDIYVISVALERHWFKMVDDNGEAKNPDHKEFVKDLEPLVKKFGALAEKPGEAIW